MHHVWRHGSKDDRCLRCGAARVHGLIVESPQMALSRVRKKRKKPTVKVTVGNDCTGDAALRFCERWRYGMVK